MLKFSKTVSKVCKAGVCSTLLGKHDCSLKVSIFSKTILEQEPILLCFFSLSTGQRIKHWDCIILEKNCVMCHHPKTQRSILQWVMIVWNIIRFVCGLPSGEHRDWIMVGILSFNEFFSGPWYRNDWIWKFLSNSTNWLTGSQSVHPGQGEKTLKISWFAKMQFKNWFFFRKIFHAYWQIIQSGHLFIHWEPFASDLQEKKPHSHNLSMNMHPITAINKSEKDNFFQIVAKSDDKHSDIRYDVLVICT